MNLPFHQDPTHKDPASEAAIQSAFQRKLRTNAPRIMLAGVPNAGKRTAWEGRQRKLEGMVAGFPDMLAFHGGKCAALEFKAGKGSLSDSQKDTLLRLHELQIPVGVFRSAETATEWLKGEFPDAF